MRERGWTWTHGHTERGYTKSSADAGAPSLQVARRTLLNRVELVGVRSGSLAVRVARVRPALDRIKCSLADIRDGEWIERFPTDGDLRGDMRTLPTYATGREYDPPGIVDSSSLVAKGTLMSVERSVVTDATPCQATTYGIGPHPGGPQSRSLFLTNPLPLEFMNSGGVACRSPNRVRFGPQPHLPRSSLDLNDQLWRTWSA
jgi:hypothetical protein